MVITLSKLHSVLGQSCCHLSELQSQLLCCLRSLLQLLPNTTDTLTNQVQVSLSNTHQIKPNQLLLFTIIHIFHPTPQPKELSFIFHKASKMAKKTHILQTFKDCWNPDFAEYNHKFQGLENGKKHILQTFKYKEP